jgi:hypothetical protein
MSSESVSPAWKPPRTNAISPRENEKRSWIVGDSAGPAMISEPRTLWATQPTTRIVQR